MAVEAMSSAIARAARVAELADALDLGSSELSSWGFESLRAHPARHSRWGTRADSMVPYARQTQSRGALSDLIFPMTFPKRR